MPRRRSGSATPAAASWWRTTSRSTARSPWRCSKTSACWSTPSRTARQAIELAMLTPYALVLMDMQMPRVDGVAATIALRKLPGWQTLPIIAMTANAFAEDKARCIDAGMNDFLTKPFEPDALFQKILEWLDRTPS
jgi:CheY-like chemotaxis protein